MDALKQRSISNSVTLRDGFESEIPTTELVPGDIVKLEEGINVPADIRLLEVYQCRVDEYALTGESEPITKHLDAMDVNTLLADRRNMMYMGTTVATGRAVGVVVETGMSTQLGRIASDISEAQTPKTPLELKLESLGRFLGFIALSCCSSSRIDQVDSCLRRRRSSTRSCHQAIHHCYRHLCRYCSRRIADYSCHHAFAGHA